jgi:hypothetical protein
MPGGSGTGGIKQTTGSGVAAEEFMDFINGTELYFKDISSEVSRTYEFAGGEKVTIENPLRLNVSASGGHRVFDAQGRSHYIPAGWFHLSWTAKASQPNFVA